MRSDDELDWVYGEFYDKGDYWQQIDVVDFECERWSDEGDYTKNQNEIDEYGFNDKITHSTNTAPSIKNFYVTGLISLKQECYDKFDRVHEKRYDKSDCEEEIRQCWQLCLQRSNDEDDCDKRREESDKYGNTVNRLKTLRTFLCQEKGVCSADSFFVSFQ